MHGILEESMRNIIRFVFPFLFVRNWHDGAWELSHTRLVLFVSIFFFVLLGLALAYYMQAPVVYIQ